MSTKEVIVDPNQLVVVDASYTLDASQADQHFVSASDFAIGCNLLRACSSGDKATVVQIIESQPMMIQFRDYDARTSLHVAASEGHLELVGFLLEHGANPNRSDRWGGSPLDDAMRERRRDVVEFLRAHGGLAGATNLGAALILAASRGDVDEVEALLSNGAEASTADYDRRTPLHLSCSEGHPAVVKLLIGAAADVAAEDRWHARPIDDARHKGNSECEALLIAAGGASSSGAPRAHVLPDGHSLERDSSGVVDSLAIEWKDVTVIEKLGSGAFVRQPASPLTPTWTTGCPAALPGRAARPRCPAALPGRAARPRCPARPCSTRPW
jgi:hypothetical protein